MDVKLSKPITVGDKQVESITVDFDKLTGADILFCIKEASASKGEVITLFEVDPEFHLQVIEKLTGIARAQLITLPARDFKDLLKPVRSFFIVSD